MSEKQVFVRVEEEFTYRLDSSTLHTVPPGWGGFIPAKEAKRLKAEKKGVVSTAPKPPKAQRESDPGDTGNGESGSESEGKAGDGSRGAAAAGASDG